jgi:hypothetical protein
MQAPTPEQLRIAIEVLGNLGERLHEEGNHSAKLFPGTQLGEAYAAKIKASTTEQITRIESVKTRLENWHDELNQQRTNHVSNQV